MMSSGIYVFRPREFSSRLSGSYLRKDEVGLIQSQSVFLHGRENQSRPLYIEGNGVSPKFHCVHVILCLWNKFSFPHLCLCWIPFHRMHLISLGLNLQKVIVLSILLSAILSCLHHHGHSAAKISSCLLLMRRIIRWIRNCPSFTTGSMLSNRISQPWATICGLHISSVCLRTVSWDSPPFP